MRSAGSQAGARQARIQARLLEQGTVSSTKLAEALDVSLMTIHRDLDAMASEGWLRRIRGGATVRRSALFELNVRARVLENQEAKRRIATAALELVSRGDAVFLDDSTTVLALAQRLDEVGPLTAITNFRRIVEGLVMSHEIDLIELGGYYHAANDSFIGDITVLGIENLRADTAFVSTSAVRGDSCFHQAPESISVKRAMLAASERKVLLLDHSKFGKRALHRFVGLSGFDTVIVDDATHDEVLDQLDTLNIEVIVARESAVTPHPAARSN